MEVQGKIVEIFDTVQVSDNFRKREFVIEYAENPQYPEFLKFECIQDKCNMLDEFSAGQEVMVSLNLKGRKWTDPQGNVKYFNSLQAWKIQPAGQAAPSPAPATPKPSSSNATAPGGQIFSADDDSEEDLPF